MTYALIAVFLASGQVYVERGGLQLQECAGRAAMARLGFDAVSEDLTSRIGPVKFMCVAEGQR